MSQVKIRSACVSSRHSHQIQNYLILVLRVTVIKNLLKILFGSKQKQVKVKYWNSMGSSSQRVAIMTSIQTYNLLSNKTIVNKMESNAIGAPISSSGTYRTEVNTLLAGSIMITLSLLIMGLCLFLHRKLKSSTGTVSLHTLPWTDENLEVYTLSGQEEITGIYLPPTPSPPPSYETVVKVHEKQIGEVLRKSVDGCNLMKKTVCEDDDLPSYEAAIKLREQGYI